MHPAVPSRSLRGSAATLLLGMAALAPAWSAVCPLPDPQAGDACSIGIGPLQFRLGSGQFSFDGDSQSSGDDASVNGYTVGTFAVPALDLLQLGGGRFGFAFSPGMNGEVGFSRFLGEHQISATFAFSDIAFVAEPGWEIVSMAFSVEGLVQRSGLAALFLDLPGTPDFTDDSFVATGALPLGTTGFGAGFNASVNFEEDEDGNAAGEGDARVRFDRVTVLAQMHPVQSVPEPGTVALLLAAAAAGGLTARRRRT